MQWEYRRAWVYQPDEETDASVGWLVIGQGGKRGVDEYLRRMGEEGWELVGAVVSAAWSTGGGPIGIDPRIGFISSDPNRRCALEHPPRPGAQSRRADTLL